MVKKWLKNDKKIAILNSMDKNRDFVSFFKQSFSNFLEAILNIFIFLPHYFSVRPLLKTLFRPWKNLVSRKTIPGFSFEDWFNRLSFNVISRGMGFMMRSAIIIFYVFLQLFYIISIPVIFVVFVFISPLRYFLSLFSKSEKDKKKELFESFLSSHLLKEENRNIVETWFEKYYQFQHIDYHWWRLKNLLSAPPIARDWAVGYTATLDQYAEELTLPTYQGRITETVDREHEIEQIETTLSKNEEANVLITGEEGVGKHSVIDALAKRIYDGSINPLLVYKRILKINFEKVLTQASDQKLREAVVESLFQEATEADNIILIIENLDKYVISGTDRVNLTTPLEKYSGSDRLNFIATSTPFNFQKYIFPNKQISKSFTKIDVNEVSSIDAERILLDKALIFESKKKVIIPYETIKNVIEKSDFFITNIPFPEKAIKLLDNACAYAVKNSPSRGPVIILPEIIDTVVTQITHIPTQLNADMKQKLINLEGQLGNRVLSQTKAISQLAASLRKSFLMLGKRKKPLATFLFLGPTGVGKTETAKALTQTFFGSEKYIIRLDMSLYQDRGDIPNLIGSMESQNPGLMTKTIRENPYGVLLLDEIEKANRDLLNIFLTILDEGYFTDGMGQRVDCKNLIIIATSNAGSDYIYQLSASGKDQMKDSDLINYLIGKKYFSPEFLNRFDGVIAYQMLDQKTVMELGRRIITRMVENYEKLYKVHVQLSDQTLIETVSKGYHPEFGARDLERVITQQLEDKITKQILDGTAGEGSIITL